MDVIWLTPIAWLGLTLLALPVLIHLLTNQQTPVVSFPTLRFLRHTRLAAIRRRALQNWVLLAVRTSMLAAAVAALAAPVFVSASRQEEWRRRTARAVVVTPGTAAADVASLVDIERRDSFSSEVFRPTRRLADGLRDAALWLRRQPPSALEVVVMGNLRIGATGPADLALVPEHVGLRFLPVPSGGSGSSADLRFQESNTLWRARTALNDTGTRVSYAREDDPVRPITVRAAPEDYPAALAALNAVMARGIDIDREKSRQVMVVFQGAGPESPVVPAVTDLTPWMREALAALPDTEGGAAGDVFVLYARRRASTPEAAHFLERVARVVFLEDRASLEPSQISAPAIAQWSRAPRAVEGQPVQDEGDRRWLWGVVLVLMAIETVLGRARSRAGEAPNEAARVA